MKDKSEINKGNEYHPISYYLEHKLKLFDEDKVLESREKIIQSEIRNIKDDTLSESQKRLYVLNEMNTSNVSKEKSLSKKKSTSKKKNMNQSSDNEVRDNTLSQSPEGLFVLNEMNPSNSNNDNEITKEQSISTVDNTTSFSLNEGSTNASTLSFIESHKVGDAKKNYWLKYDLIDVKLNNKIDNLDLCQLDGEKYCYIYKNSLNTYYFIQNVHFGKNYIINDETSKDPDYKESFGLFFCGKKVEYNNNTDVKCCPNEMICKNCMEKNKKRYQIDNLNLVNINGRTAQRKNKELGFYCYGHFIKGNQIEICNKEFKCEACKLLDRYENYYFPSH
jgi:hypothetical protein